MDSHKKPNFFNNRNDDSTSGYNNNSRFKNNGSPQRELDEYARMAFTMKIISGSDTLMMFYNDYEKEEKEKETYNNEIKKYEANTRGSFVDLYDLGDHEKVGSMSDIHVVITHANLRQQMWLHVLLQYKTFSSLQVRFCCWKKRVNLM